MTRDAEALPAEAQEVLDFWFGELDQKAWWTRDAAVDEAIATRFAGLYERLSAGVPETWRETSLGCLAAVIVLDQFPRNLYRDDARAYDTDAAALALSQDAIARGLHETLNGDQQGFLYMPFQHCEDRDIQARSVELFGTLDNAQSLTFAEQHKVIVDRFGRFPHRNACLGRETTDEEREFLEGPALFW